MSSAPNSPAPPAQDLLRNLLRVSDLVRDLLACGVDKARFDRITVNQARIFSHILRSLTDGRPVRLKGLARELGVSSAAASQAVERLVEADLLLRVPDPDDRRAVRLSFSPRGEALLRDGDRRAADLFADLAAACPSDDYAAFARVLSLFCGALEARWAAVLAQKDAARPPSRRTV